MTRPSLASRIVGALLCVALVAAGAFGAWWFHANKPRAHRGAAPKVIAPAVTVIPARQGSVQLEIRALGTVSSARQISLRSRVAGMVAELSPEFEPGAKVRAGTVLARIDPADFQIAVRLQEAALAKAKADLEIEMGQQAVARQELATMAATTGVRKDSRLARRGPQLDQAKASVKTAEANLAQARLDLERTEIRAPFNALVKSREAAPGMQVSTADTLATLACTDEYRVEASVPLERLNALGLPSFAGLKATVFASGSKREGVVLHDIATLDSTTRMGRLLIRVEDPLGLEKRAGQAPLLLDNQCEVRLDGGTLLGVAKLPRKVLRSGGAIWIAAPAQGGHHLDVRAADIAWSDDEAVYLRNVQTGELVVDSALGGAIHGMPLTVPAAAADRARPQADGSAR